jgi:hypothetical protein
MKLFYVFNKIGEEGRKGSAWRSGGLEAGRKGSPKMYTHMNKCINN